MLGVLLLLLSFLFVLGSSLLWVYGTVLCFQKKWYVGLLGLVVPLFAQVIGGAKLLGKDLLS